MLKMGGRGAKNGKPIEFMVIGLSYTNLDKLREGKPIRCSGQDFGLSGEVEIIIFSGETEQSMAREFAEMIGPNTNTTIDPRFKD